jgi:hypothetical protein
VLDNVTIAYRGATYELGRGRDYFGIWTMDGPRSQPLESWPETQEGWSAAWARFSALEVPETITPAAGDAAQGGAVTRRLGATAGTGGGVLPAALLLGVGVALGVFGLFPAYLNGTSLASQSDNLAAHVIYLAAWAVSAVLIALGGSRLRIGALLASGVSIVTFGLLFTDAGTPIAGGAHLAGAGLVLSLLGWLACAAGSGVAFWLSRPQAGTAVAGTGAAGRWLPVGRLRGSAVGPAVLLILAGLGAAAAFAPAWDSFTLRSASGQSQTLTAGNAFAEPGPVIAGSVAVMVALAAVVIAAAFWRPARHGAVLLAGAVIPMAAQAISAIIQVGQPISPSQFGFSAAQVQQLGLTVSAGLTPAFWIYAVLIVVLVVSCAWMLFTPQQTADLAGPAAGTADGPDAEAPTWHVAHAGAYDVTGPRADEDPGFAAGTAPAPAGETPPRREGPFGWKAEDSLDAEAGRETEARPGTEARPEAEARQEPAARSEAEAGPEAEAGQAPEGWSANRQ